MRYWVRHNQVKFATNALFEQQGKHKKPMANIADDLFRTEARDHKLQRFHGKVMLTRTWSYPVLTAFLCSLLLVIIVFSLMFGFTRKETVSGMVVPNQGLIRLAAPQSGILTHSHVKEGQQVMAGQALFVLLSERNSQQGAIQANINATLNQRIDYLQREMEQSRQQNTHKQQELNLRLANLRASLQVLANDLTHQRKRVQLIRDVADRIATLEKSGTVSKLALNEKTAEAMEQESRLAAIELQQLTLQREVTTLEAQRQDLPHQAEREISSINRNIEELKQQISESEAKREIVIRAEQTGTISAITVNLGQAITADQGMASLVPHGSILEVELYAPTRAAGFVQVGTPVLLRYEAFPYQKFGQFRATVREISQNTLPLGDLQNIGAAFVNQNYNASNAAEPVYRIRVALAEQSIQAYGRLHPLKPGMQLAASLVLEQRTVAEWALAPLYGITK